MSLKTIRATVGKACANIPTDVATIQYLLNCVPVSQGGPKKELVIDGFVGVLTTEAIKCFQEFHFGSSESVIKPSESGGETFDKLKRYDPLPNSPPVVLPHSKSGGTKDSKQVGGSKGFPQTFAGSKDSPPKPHIVDYKNLPNIN